MKVIEMLSEKIEKTIDSAEEYITEAAKYKVEFPEVAKALSNLSEIEMSNMSALHSTVVNVITAYRKQNGEPPAPMIAVYDYLHKKHIDHAAKVKAMQSLYKES